MSGLPIIVVGGPTGSGKTSLAISLARKYNGEIICADSRTIYKKLDIGTAKPSLKQQEKVKHYLLNVLEPDEEFSAAKFKRLAESAIKEIRKKGKTPFIVGGSGLYIDSLVYDFSFVSLVDHQMRTRYQKMSLEQLNKEAKLKQIEVPNETKSNHRHLVRLLERNGIQPTKKPLSENVLFLGIKIEKNNLSRVINNRVETMIKDGLLQEAQTLIEGYGKEAAALQTPGYKAINEFFENKISMNDAKKIFVQNDLNLAKRQMTWMRKNKDIIWINNGKQAEQQIDRFLLKFDTI